MLTHVMLTLGGHRLWAEAFAVDHDLAATLGHLTGLHSLDVDYRMVSEYVVTSSMPPATAKMLFNNIITTY